MERTVAVLAQRKSEEREKYLEQTTFKSFFKSRELKTLSSYADYYHLQDDFIGLYQIEDELYKWKATVKMGGVMKRLIIESV